MCYLVLCLQGRLRRGDWGNFREFEAVNVFLYLQLVKSLDADGDGVIDVKEFFAAFKRVDL